MVKWRLVRFVGRVTRGYSEYTEIKDKIVKVSKSKTDENFFIHLSSE